MKQPANRRTAATALATILAILGVIVGTAAPAYADSRSVFHIYPDYGWNAAFLMKCANGNQYLVPQGQGSGSTASCLLERNAAIYVGQGKQIRCKDYFWGGFYTTWDATGWHLINPGRYDCVHQLD